MTANCAYAPSLDSDEAIKDESYNSLHTVVLAIPRANKILLLGDFNTRVGTRSHLLVGVLGKHGGALARKRGATSIFCAEHNLPVTNTFFQLRNILKTTWMH